VQKSDSETRIQKGKKSAVATSLKEIENAVEAIVNVLYLIEVDVNNPENVLEYVKMTDQPMTTLMRLVDEIRAVS
jgi:hypothetical protein